MPHSTQINENSTEWNTSINSYNDRIKRNAINRLARMNDDEIARYKALHNLSSGDNDEVLANLMKTGEFRGVDEATSNDTHNADDLNGAPLKYISDPVLRFAYPC